MSIPEDDVGLVWFALRTNPRCEKRAAEGLRAKGLRAFVPEEVVWKKRRKRVKPERIKRPLFVRYIFAGAKPEMPVKTNVPASWIVTIDGVEQEIKGWQTVERPIGSVEQAFYDIRQTDGVEGIVGINGLPIAIPRRYVSELIYGTASGMFDTTRKAFEDGDTVRIAEGPFRDLIGRVLRSKRGNRFEVVLELFGKEHKLSIEPADLRMVQKHNDAVDKPQEKGLTRSAA